MEKNFFDELENDIISKENKIEQKNESKATFKIEEYLNSFSSNKIKTDELNLNNKETPDSNKENNDNKIDFDEPNLFIKRLNTAQNITYKNNNQNNNSKKLFEDIFNTNEEEKRLEEDLFNSLKGNNNSIKLSKTLKIQTIFIDDDKKDSYVDDLKNASQKQKEENKNVSDQILLNKINDEKNNLINIEILKLMKYIESDNIEYLMDDIKKSIIIINNKYEECFNLYIEMINKSKGNIIKINEFFNWIDTTLKTFFETKNSVLFLKFSEFIYNKISDLLEISVTNTCKLIDLYYNDTNEYKKEIIKKLDKYPEIQLKYLNKYIEEFDTEKKDYEDEISEYLTKKIKLLIILNHKEQVIHMFKNYPFLCNSNNINEFINLFQKNNVNNALIYILQNQNQNEEAFNLAIKEVNNYFDDILYLLNQSSFNENKFNILLEKYNYYLNIALNICYSYEKKQKKKNEKNEEENEEEKEDEKEDEKDNNEEKQKNFELWIKLFKCLYDNFKKFFPDYSKNKNNEKTIHYYILNQSLNKNKLEILRKITDVVAINNVIEIFIEKINGIEIKEFNEILQELMINYNKMLYIMKIGLETLNNTIFFGLNNIIKMLKKGYNFSLNFCSLCGKDIRENGLDNIYLFTCHHHYHKRCCTYIDEKYICYICAKKESYYGVYNDNLNIENKISDSDNNNYKEDKEKITEKKYELIERQRKINKINLNKLKEMKKKHNDLFKLMINFKKGQLNTYENFYN